MAKQNQKDIRRDTQTEGRRINTDADQLNQLLYGGLPKATERGNQIFGDAYRGYSDVASGSGRSRPNFSGYESAFKGFSDNPFRDVDKNRFRGGGVYDEYAKTGGMNAGDISNIRARGTRTIPAMFDSVKDEINRKSAITGASPSYTSSMSRLARDQSRGAQDAASDVEYEIMDRRNKGRMWGAEGMSGSEQALGQYGSGNRKFGLEGAIRAATAGGDYDLSDAGLRLQGTRGLESLRGQIPAEEYALYDRILNGMGQRGGLQGNNIGQRASYDPNISAWDRAMQVWKQLNSSASAYASGGGKFP